MESLSHRVRIIIKRAKLCTSIVQVLTAHKEDNQDILGNHRMKSDKSYWRHLGILKKVGICSQLFPLNLKDAWTKMVIGKTFPVELTLV